MNKTFAKVGVVGMVVLGITECHMIVPEQPAVAEEHSPQKLEIAPHFGMINQIMFEPSFERGTYKVLENVQPWLDPEQQDKQIPVEDLKKILRYVGFEGYSLRMAQAIVFLESTRKYYAHNTNARTGDNSYGLFQINMIGKLEEERLELYRLDRNEALFNPLINARVAYEISNGGRDWSAWTTYPKAKNIVGNYSS